MSLDKVGAMVASLSVVAPSLFTNDLTTPVLGVPLTTVGCAVLGTYVAIAYDDSARPRGRLFALGIGTVLLASTLVGWVPSAFGWAWSSGKTEAALAATAALLVYYFLPPAIQRGRELIREFKLSDLLPFRTNKGGAADPRDALPPPPDGPDGPREPMEDPNK